MVSGCDLAGNVEDLGNALVDPDSSLLDAPGRKLADGKYSNLELDGSLDKGGYVLARRHDVEPESLAIISFVGDGQCEVSPVAAFQRVSSRVDVALPGLIAYHAERDANGKGDVNFIGFDCKPRLTPIASASLPDVPFPRNQPTGLLTLATNGELSLVDARNDQLVSVASNVSNGRAEGKFLWTLEEGVAVVYDKELEEVASWGSNIRELVIRGGSQDPSAMLVDDEGLSFVTVATGEKTPVSETGCAPVSLGTGIIGYLDPCESRTLKLSIPGSYLLADEERVTVTVADGVANHQAVMASFQDGNGVVLFLTGEPGSVTGELHTAGLSGEEANATNDRMLAPNAFVSAGSIFLDWNGQSGQLVVPSYDDEADTLTIAELVDVAPNVAQMLGGTLTSQRGILENFDGVVGDLSVVSSSGDTYETKKLASRVPVQDQTVEIETGDFAFVGDFDGTSGTAYLVHDGKARAVGEKAFPGTLRFLDNPRAVAYLADNGKPGTAKLRAWLIDAELDLHVADRVTEYRELPWPSSGLLYAVPEGDAAGIWFAKAR